MSSFFRPTTTGFGVEGSEEEFRPTVLLENLENEALRRLHETLNEKMSVCEELDEMKSDLETFNEDAYEKTIKALSHPLDSQAKDEAVKANAFGESIQSDISKLKHGRLKELEIAEIYTREVNEQREVRKNQRIGFVRDTMMVIKQERAIATVFKEADMAKASLRYKFDQSLLGIGLKLSAALLKASNAEHAAYARYSAWVMQEALTDAALILGRTCSTPTPAAAAAAAAAALHAVAESESEFASASASASNESFASVSASRSSSTSTTTAAIDKAQLITMWRSRVARDKSVCDAYNKEFKQLKFNTSTGLQTSLRVRIRFLMYRANEIYRADQRAAKCLIAKLTEETVEKVD